MLQWRELRADERENWYRDRLQRDFPADELKPFAVIEKLVGQGDYHCWLFTGEDGRPAAYAYLMTAGEYILLDYLAVEPEARGQGIGSQVLPVLVEQIIGDKTMLIEAENPACARSLSDRDVRQARIRFYQKGGMHLSGVLSSAFGVEFRILTGGRLRSDQEIAQAVMDVYFAMLPEPVVRQQVKSWLP